MRLDGAPRLVAQLVVTQRSGVNLKASGHQERVLADAAKRLMMLVNTARINGRPDGASSA